MLHFFLFPLVGSFPSEPPWNFMDAVKRLSVQLHATAFPANYSFTKRKNLQGMHFKPENQARQQTFASDKTKSGVDGK